MSSPKQEKPNEPIFSYKIRKKIKSNKQTQTIAYVATIIIIKALSTIAYVIIRIHPHKKKTMESWKPTSKQKE